MAPRLVIAMAATLLCACGSSTAAGSSTTTGAASTTSAAASTTSAASSATSAASPGAGAGGAPCGPAGARTLAASRRARVYSAGGAVLGCTAGSRRHYVLGVSTSCLMMHPLVGRAAVNGTLAAYATERCGIDTGFTEIVVRRLTDGKILAHVPATTTRLGPESHVAVTALVLAASGSAAWISAGGSIVGTRTVVEVHALKRGAVSRLDIGRGINRTVLRLSGTRLRWRHSGRWHAAMLS